MRDLSEAVRNVPGVAQGAGSSTRGSFEEILLRGFDASNDIQRNGLRDATYQFKDFDTAGIERVEVLKGPASVLYGQGSLGGVINYVSKQPLSEPYAAVEASAGSFNFYRGAIDLSGPLNPSKTVLYRLNLATQTIGSFVDFYDQQRYFVAPVVSWQISDRTKVTFTGEYHSDPTFGVRVVFPLRGVFYPIRMEKSRAIVTHRSHILQPIQVPSALVTISNIVLALTGSYAMLLYLRRFNGTKFGFITPD